MIVSWWEMATRYPVASVSSALFYLSLVPLISPAGRAWAARYFTHPVKPHQQQIGALDSLRGVAALAVAFCHIWWFSRPIFDTTINAAPFLAMTGNKAVPVFCVLSGFLIYRSVLSAKKSEAGLRSYGIRRFFRIYPVYALSILLAVWFSLYNVETTRFWTFLFAEISMLRAIGFGPIANPATWSLYIEVLFYALLPFLLMMVGRKRMLPVAVILFLIITIGADGQGRGLSLWKFFALGIIASEVSSRLGSQQQLAGNFLVVIGGGLTIFDLASASHDWFTAIGLLLPPPSYHSMGLGLGFAMLIAGLPHSRIAARLLSLPPLQALGMISYSLFLLHPFYIIANFPEVGAAKFHSLYEQYKALGIYAPVWYLPLAVLPGSIFWAAVSFLLVERPGMLLGNRIAKAQPSPGIRTPGHADLGAPSLS